MGAQRLGRVVVARQLGLAERRVNFIMANLMHQNDRPALAALQLGRQVMQALLGIRRDRAMADRAYGIGVVYVVLLALMRVRMARGAFEARA